MFFWVVANYLLLLGISELEHNQSWSQEGEGGIRAMSPTNAQKGVNMCPPLTLRGPF